MRENRSTKWSLALSIVANIKNRKYHSGKLINKNNKKISLLYSLLIDWLTGIKQSPYKAVFGIESYVGMEKLNLPEDTTNKIKTAQQLYAVLAGFSKCFYFFKL
jgi:hypothetical protein